MKKEKEKQKIDCEYDVEDLKKYMDLPVKEKLQYLEEMNEFLSRVMPPESKRIWEELKKMGC